MSKELEALESIRREAGIPYFSTLYDSDMWREDFKTVETALKALEIIKTKNVNVYWLKTSANLSRYNLAVGTYQELTTQGYKLLREVLGSITK